MHVVSRINTTTQYDFHRDNNTEKNSRESDYTETQAVNFNWMQQVMAEQKIPCETTSKNSY